MEIVSYKREPHAAGVTECFISQGTSTDLIDSLPEIGFVAIKDETIIAASFMRMVEGGHCLFDGLVTNAKFNSFTRHLAIEACVKKLIEKAKDMNLKKILAYSIDTGTIERSRVHGFILMPHRMIVLELEQKR